MNIKCFIKGIGYVMIDVRDHKTIMRELKLKLILNDENRK